MGHMRNIIITVFPPASLQLPTLKVPPTLLPTWLLSSHEKTICSQHSLPVSSEPPLLMDASEFDWRIWPPPDDPFPPADSRWSLRRCRRWRNRLRRNEPEFRTPAILLKSVAGDPVVDKSVTSHVLRRRLPSSSTLYMWINFTILYLFHVSLAKPQPHCHSGPRRQDAD